MINFCTTFSSSTNETASKDSIISFHQISVRRVRKDVCEGSLRRLAKMCLINVVSDFSERFFIDDKYFQGIDLRINDCLEDKLKP